MYKYFWRLQKLGNALRGTLLLESNYDPTIRHLKLQYVDLTNKVPSFCVTCFLLKWPVSIYIRENNTKLYLLGRSVALPQRSVFHGRLLCAWNSAEKKYN